MGSQKRTALYQIEKQILQAYISGTSREDLEKQRNELADYFCDNSLDKIIKYLNQMLKIVNAINISSSVLALGEKITINNLSNRITDVEFSEAKRYVEQLLDVDLTNVSLKYFENHQEMVEGRCASCNDSHHVVLIPRNSGQVLSTDLLVHELGHAAEFTMTRETGQDALLWGHSSLSEAIAYYCQLKYLTDKGTRNQRIGAFGTFYLTYLTVCVVRHCLSTKMGLCDLKPSDAFESGYYDDILAAYPDGGENKAKDTIAKNIKFFQDTYGDLVGLMHNDFSPRLGFVFALFLLDKPIQFIKSLALQNTLENDFFTLAKTIVPDLKEYSALDRRLLLFYS